MPKEELIKDIASRVRTIKMEYEIEILKLQNEIKKEFKIKNGFVLINAIYNEGNKKKEISVSITSNYYDDRPNETLLELQNEYGIII